MVGQHALPFPVLTDPGCAVAGQFGLAYTIPDYHRDYYRSILVNVPFINGDDTWRLILPATYVISPGRENRSCPGPRRLPRAARAGRGFGRSADCSGKIATQMESLARRASGRGPQQRRYGLSLTPVFALDPLSVAFVGAGFLYIRFRIAN